MSKFIVFFVLGLGPGAAYALLGQGIVATYQGSGVVNFSQGATGMFLAYVYIKFIDNGVPLVAGLLLVAAIGFTFGLVLYLKIMRPLRSAPMLARVVATLGVLLFLQGAATLIFGDNTPGALPSMMVSSSVTVFGATVGVANLELAAICVGTAIILWAFYRFTPFGLATRAASENQKGASLLGHSPDWVGSINWGIGVSLSAVAGVLIAPITGVSVEDFTIIVVPALAAALLGRFVSMGWTTAAALGIGVIGAELNGYTTHPGLADSVPFVIIIIAMAVTGKLIPPRGSITLGRPPLATRGRISPFKAFGVLALGVLVAVFVGSTYQTALASSAVAAVIALSVVVITGFAGQISLAQMAFAGISGLMASKFAVNLGIGFPWSLILAALCAVPVGILIGLPALRVRGINLAVVTLGAAVAINSLIFVDAGLTGGSLGLNVPPPSLFGYSLAPATYPFRFAIFAMVVLFICCLGVANLRRSASGQNMLAVRDNERAAAAMGVNVTATKLTAFAISSFLAGLGGALLALQVGQLSLSIGFDASASLLLVVFVYLGGIGSIGGALFTGLIFAGGLIPTFIAQTVPSIDTYLTLIGGLTVISMAIDRPDGLIESIGMRLPSWPRSNSTSPSGPILASEPPKGSGTGSKVLSDAQRIEAPVGGVE